MQILVINNRVMVVILTILLLTTEFNRVTIPFIIKREVSSPEDGKHSKNLSCAWEFDGGGWSQGT